MPEPDIGVEPEDDADTADAVSASLPRPSEEDPKGMLPARGRRGTRVERGAMRVLATSGIIGFGTALGALLVGQDVEGWIVGLAVSVASVLMAAILWSSRQL